MEKAKAELKEMVAEMTREQFEWFIAQAQLLLFPEDG